MRRVSLALVFLMLLVLGCQKDTLTNPEIENANLEAEAIDLRHRNRPVIQRVAISEFQPAGDLGGPENVLVPGTFFPPKKRSFARLVRKSNSLQHFIHTKGLPRGAYTVWYVIFNDPTACVGPGIAGGNCGDSDIFLPSASVVWSTGRVVRANGVGNFWDRIHVGEQREETILLGADLTSPLENPKGAEVHMIIKYHGLASEDPDILYSQLHTLLGNCGPDDGANSFDAGPFGIQCFDPHLAVFSAN